ncbi:MAG: recombinase family protein [Defluviitaleaceae bacterium]|nr:recombinase family protein [Defluviitaleaceae bacterium]
MTIAIYSRKSRFTGKGDSIANQIELCKQRALQYVSQKNISKQNYKILTYEDEGFSGKNTARPEFQKMLAAIKANEISCVVCYKLDRISRNVGDFAQTYEMFEKYKVDFLCAGETYDTTTPAGRAMMGMVSVFAQMEREVTAERIRDNMHLLARSGRWLGGHTPTGFKSHKEEHIDADGKTRSAFKLVPMKKEMELVEFIYKKFSELQSVSGTMRYLVTNNISTKNGNDFTSLAVKEILRNPVYCIAGQEALTYFLEKGADICFEENEMDDKHGFMPYNRTSSGKDKQTRNETKDWLIAVGKHDGIIPTKSWVKIQKILNAKREKVKSAVRTPYKSKALLSGLLVCGKCNSAMRPHIHTKRKNTEGVIPYYYICEMKERSLRIRCDMCNANGEMVDKAIIDTLMKYKYAESAIKKSLQELKERLVNKKISESNKVGLLESELEAKQKQINKLINALGENGAQDTFFELTRQKVNELGEQCNQLKNEIEKAALNNTIYTDYKNQTHKDTMQTATVVEKRELLKSTIERIVWDGEQVNIFICE